MIDTSDIDAFVNEVEKVFGKVYVEIFPVMSRGDMELIMVKTGNVLVPVSEDVAEELGCNHNELFIMIKPIDETFTMKFYIYKIENTPKMIREITLKEILSSD